MRRNLYSEVFLYLCGRQAGVLNTANSIARAIGSNPGAVRRAVGHLRHDGLVSTRPRGHGRREPHLIITLTGKCPHCGRDK
jgi:DNA-binding MarR family transcriptional regulator